MSACAIDHITVVASTLERGVAFVEEALGVVPGPGGAHPKMGTHNRLLRLGDTLFLEVIAVDPSVPAPSRPRWFELDVLASDAAPRLATWVVRVGDLRIATASLPEDVGVIEALTRGDLRWLLTVPADGSMPLAGVAPALIEWPSASHPASRMATSGCALRRLDLFHPEPERLVGLLDAIGLADARVRVSSAAAARLIAQIDTPHGPRAIGA